MTHHPSSPSLFISVLVHFLCSVQHITLVTLLLLGSRSGYTFAGKKKEEIPA